MAAPTAWRVTCHDCRHQEDTEGRVKPSRCPSCNSPSVAARKKQPTWDVVAIVSLPDGSWRQVVTSVEATRMDLASQRAAGRVMKFLADNRIAGRSNPVALNLDLKKRAGLL